MTAAMQQRGVTLPEVLISLLIFALIATASVYSVHLGVNARDQLDVATEDLRQLQIAHTLLREDLAQATPRRVRDEFGIQNSAAFFGGDLPSLQREPDEGELLVAYVRSGWLNPNGAAPRSTLQYVELIFKEGAVYRRARTFLDEADNAQYVERLLFADIENAYVEFPIASATGDVDWVTVWPAPGGGDTLPLAMALVLERSHGAPERQLFWIGDTGNV